MVSVTSDIVATPSFQAPQPRAKADASPGNDSFASLVDSNTTAAADNNDRANGDRAQDVSPAPQPSASDRRAAPSRRDDAAVADKGQSRDTSADGPGRNDASERDVTATDQTGADQPTPSGSTVAGKTKTAAGKSDESQPAEKPASDETEAGDAIDSEAATGQASAGSGPLAIAAAAIAASTAVTEAATAPAPPLAGTDATKTVAAEAKADAKTTGTETIARAGLDAEAAETATTGIVLTATAARPAPSKAAAAAKASASTGDTATASDEADAPKTSTDTPAVNVATDATVPAEQPAINKPAVANAHIGTAKAESVGALPPTAGAAHLNPAGQQDAVSGQTNVQANNVQAASAFQPLLQTIAAPSQPSFTVTAATQATAVPLSGLVIEIAASVRSGKSRFEIRLDPAELGRIDVRVDVDRNGQVTSHLTVEKPETLSMLRQDAPQLQRALNDAGLSTGDGGLQFSLRDQSSSGQNGNQSNPNAQRLILTEEESVPAAVVGSYGRMLAASGGVDIRV